MKVGDNNVGCAVKEVEMNEIKPLEASTTSVFLMIMKTNLFINTNVFYSDK